MAELLILCVVAGGFLLYAADRVIKARSQARHVRAMSERLAAAAAKADERQEKRQAEAAASAALTSVVPAIRHPVLAPAGEQDQAEEPGD